MAIIIYPPTDYIITEVYMDKVLTTDSAAYESPNPGVTKEDSSKVVLSKDDGYIDDSFLNYSKINNSLNNQLVGAIEDLNNGDLYGSNYPANSVVITDENGKIYESAILTLTDDEITEIFNSVSYP